LALRPEMTSLVARTVATRFQSKPRPIRLSYSGEVFRWDEPRSGRQYEFHQIGLEHIGSQRLEADAEAIVVVIEALKRIALERFSIPLGQVEFFNGLGETLGLDQSDRSLMQTIIDRKQSDDLRAFLATRASSDLQNAICGAFSSSGGLEVIDGARKLASGARSAAALDDIESVFHI